MRKTLTPETESRRQDGPPGGGPYGVFKLTCPETGRALTVIASDGRDWGGTHEAPPADVVRRLPPDKRRQVEAVFGGRKTFTLPGPPWEHVSVRAPFGCPVWSEMCFVKDAFWEPGEWVMQLHPAAADHLSVHDQVLHLWRPVGAEIPQPPKELV